MNKSKIHLPEAVFYSCEYRNCSENKSVTAEELSYFDGPRAWYCDFCMDFNPDSVKLGNELFTLAEFLEENK